MFDVDHIKIYGKYTHHHKKAGSPVLLYIIHQHVGACIRTPDYSA